MKKGYAFLIIGFLSVLISIFAMIHYGDAKARARDADVAQYKYNDQVMYLFSGKNRNRDFLNHHYEVVIHDFSKTSENDLALDSEKSVAFCQAIMHLFDTIEESSQKVGNHLTLYIKIKDHDHREYSVAKLHIDFSSNHLRIFPIANSSSFREISLNDQNDPAVKSVSEILQTVSSQLKKKTNASIRSMTFCLTYPFG